MEQQQNLTKKQKRELKKEQQRQKQKEMNKKQSYKKYGIWGLIAIVIIGGIFFLSQRKSTETNFVAWTKGPDNARVKLVEFSDLQCPACQAYAPILKQLHETFPNDLQITYKHFPLVSIHPSAMEAAYATEAAGNQGKFWEMHDILFENQSEWSPLSNPTSTFESYAQTIGLNIDQYKSDVNSSEVKKRVRENRSEGLQKRVNSTPTMFVNGTKIDNPRSFDAFKRFIELELSLLPQDTVVEPETEEEFHVHADFKVYINNEVLDFTADKYQSTDEKPLHKYVHLHDGNGDIIHAHAKDISLGEFFTSLGYTITDECITTDEGKEFCNSDGKTLKMFVNKQGTTNIKDYVFNDLDQILISYGNEDQKVLQDQLVSLSDEACIYSETCPERGTPPKESCVGGLGSKCSAGESHDHNGHDHN